MRLERIDALRGCAVLGILLVNVWGFVHGYTPLRYGVGDAGLTDADRLAVFLVAAFAEQKFYPIFAFLFGAGFALQRRGKALPDFIATYRRRLRWLLGCGLLHGSLLWLGDILTTYAVAGYWLVRRAGTRPRQLMQSLRRVVIVNILIQLLLLVGYFNLPSMAEQAADAERMLAVYSGGSWTGIAQARLTDFGTNLFNMVFFVPWLVLLFLLGVLAVRLGPLVRPERHRALWRRILRWGFGLALPLNLWWGYVAMATMSDTLHPPLGAELAGFLVNLAGPALGAAYVALFMLGAPAPARLGRLLAPVGRLSLTNYLMQSVLLMLLLQGFALGLGAVLPRAGLLALCAAIMLWQLAFSHWWLRRHRTGPVEAIWRRYAEQPAMVK